MNDRSRLISAPLARWSSRIAFFSASLALIDLVLHRLTSFPTPVAINVFAVSLAGAALGALIGLVALAQIWRRGYAGAGSAAIGVLLPVVMVAYPLTFLPAYMNLPRIADVTTDTASPPRFVSLAKQRTEGANPAAYPGERVALEQQKAYPDLRTFVMERSVEEAFELVEEAVRKMRWRVTNSEPPTSRPAKPGLLEATDQTLVAGFTDDIVIRIEGSATRARVDVRSASRYGRFDMGQNALRVRRFMAELQTRYDLMTGGVVTGRRVRSTRTGAMAKKPKERDLQKVESRSSRDRAQSNAQRARAQREMQR